MKLRCKKCGRKFEVSTNDKGIPKRDVCDECRAKELKKELEKLNANSKRTG